MVSVHGHEDAVAELAVERPGAVPLAPRVLDEEDLARADPPRLAVAGGDLHARVPVDDVLAPRSRGPVEVVVGRHLAEDDPGRRKARREPPRAGRFGGRGLDVPAKRIALRV